MKLSVPDPFVLILPEVRINEAVLHISLFSKG
jgi:hypothetical protein